MVNTDGVDTLLDEAARRQWNLREALCFLCEHEIAKRDQPRLHLFALWMGLTSRPSPRSMQSKSGNWLQDGGSHMAMGFSCWGRPQWARRI